MEKRDPNSAASASLKNLTPTGPHGGRMGGMFVCVCVFVDNFSMVASKQCSMYTFLFFACPGGG